MWIENALKYNRPKGESICSGSRRLHVRAELQSTVL